MTISYLYQRLRSDQPNEPIHATRQKPTHVLHLLRKTAVDAGRGEGEVQQALLLPDPSQRCPSRHSFAQISRLQN
jgi:hypothetical protein